MQGYQHSSYAAAFTEYGQPIGLSRSKAWLLKREIEGTGYHDAMGMYPLFVCCEWSQLYDDLEDLSDEVISLTVVADPFGSYSESYLKSCFPDVCRPFKHHYVIDLSLSSKTYICEHHRRNARKALQHVEVEICSNPSAYLEQWIRLYGFLVERHGITGMPAFSRASFAQQMQVPGLVTFRALHDGETVGMLLWYLQNQIVYYHLGAYSDIGYKTGSSFALFYHAIRYFANTGVKWLNLGAGAGAMNKKVDGLNRFKKGWATGVRPSYFCGRIFDHAKYQELVSALPISVTDYFPAYRKGEFA